MDIMDRDSNELGPNPLKNPYFTLGMQSYRIQNYEMNFTIFYNLHSRLICIRASADRRVLKWFQFIWIWHWTMSDSLLIIKIPLHFRSAASRRAREDAPWEEQGTGTFSQASTIRHRWSDDGNWGQYYAIPTTPYPQIVSWSCIPRCLSPPLCVSLSPVMRGDDGTLLALNRTQFPMSKYRDQWMGGGNNMVTRRQWDTWSGW